MKLIKNGIKYDTETSEKIGQYHQGIKGQYIYLTPTGLYFFEYYGQSVNRYLRPICEQTAKRFLGRFNPDIYEEIYGEIIEEPVDLYKDVRKYCSNHYTQIDLEKLKKEEFISSRYNTVVTDSSNSKLYTDLMNLIKL